MANERTFLAWLRASLSLVTVGIGILQLLKLKIKGDYDDPVIHFAKPVGAGFIVVGIYTLFQGCVRYFRVQSMLISSFYPASQISVGLLAVAVFFLATLTLLIVFMSR